MFRHILEGGMYLCDDVGGGRVPGCVSVLMHSDVQMQWGETVVPVW